MKSIRRWQLVTAAWATAATVIAVLAFLSTSDKDTQRLTDSAQQTQKVQRRIAALQDRVDALPQSGALTGLSKRITRLDKVTARQDRQLISLGTQQRAQAKGLAALEKRVATLETSASQGTATTPTP